MKVIGLEEHYVTAEVVEAWANLDPRWQDPVVADSAGLRQRLLEIGDQRLAAMDEAGIDVQVASLTSPGLWNLAPAVARALQSDCNDQLADAVRAHPDRLQGFATLAAPDPDAAADELSRAVTTMGFNGALVFSRVRGPSTIGISGRYSRPPSTCARRSTFTRSRLRRRCATRTTRASTTS